MQPCNDGGRGWIKFAAECRAERVPAGVYTAEVAASALDPFTMPYSGWESLKLQACFHPILAGEAPGHRGSIMRHAEAAVGAEQDDAAAATEAVIEI
jgi:hypothetical protein